MYGFTDKLVKTRGESMMKSYKKTLDFLHYGYRCIVIEMYNSHRCGYVGVPKDNKIDFHLSAHGGVTFEGHLYNDLYYYGFDTGHYGDKRDLSLFCKKLRKIIQKERLSDEWETIKDNVYCKEECKSMVSQIVSETKMIIVKRSKKKRLNKKLNKRYGYKRRELL